MSNLFPKSANKLPLQIIVFLFVFGGIATAGVTYYMTPKYTRIGYAPVQPVPFSHALHAGQLGMDCRYCHTGVDQGPASMVPTAQTCMNCHSQVKTDSPRLGVVRASYETDESIPWVRVHMLPDYAFFDHRPHVAAGVGCASCHGRIDGMVVVEQDQPLSMGWCLDCHRNPGPNLRPLDQVTNMHWDDPENADVKAAYDPTTDPMRKRQPSPPVHCSGCHR